jgi:acyl dehydratase
MLSMGLTGRMLTDWVGPASLKKYGVRFTKQVWPGDTLTATGEVTKVENGLATIRVVTTNQNGESVVEGEAIAEA